MMARKVLLDTGPLIAFLNKRDRYHEWATTQFAAIKPPLLTCEAVISESCFLLRQYKYGAVSILKLFERQLLEIPFCLQDELSEIRTLLEKYKDIPMSLADACLVRMAEQFASSTVLTLDRDFIIYCKNKRKVIPTLMPDDL